MFIFSFLSYIVTLASSVWLDSTVEDEEGTSNRLFLADAEQLEDLVILPVRWHDQYERCALLL